MRTFSFVAKTVAGLVSGLALMAVFLLVSLADTDGLRDGVDQHVEGGGGSTTISQMVDMSQPVTSNKQTEIDLICSLSDLGEKYAAECDKVKKQAKK